MGLPSDRDTSAYLRLQAEEEVKWYAVGIELGEVAQVDRLR
jgi:hypothetical protein